MKCSRIAILALAVVAPAAHAQLNQVFGAIQSVQSAITQTGKQLQPPTPASMVMQDPQAVEAEKQREAKQSSDAQSAAAQAKYQAQIAQEREAAKKANAEMDAQDQADIQASIRRDADRHQQEVAEGKKIAALCPDLVNEKRPLAENLIVCRNKGLTEAQEMTTVPSMPIGAQPYYAAMIQDVYEDNITDPRKGKAIQDYYAACAQRGTPCGRPVR